MTRLVRGADGRMWTVRSQVEWRNPAADADFEHDVSGGQGPGVLMLAVVIALAVVLVAWKPADVVVPGWLILALLLMFLFFPARWALRRPWLVVAESKATGDDLPPERWVGYVRGVLTVRNEVRTIARKIEMYSLPDIEGPLQPVD
ncbi:DUF983 domain-containing protein [Saccharothrix coeruleofusca]|uniref:DUF983 domain-containing protein n=1 Tax=Saccharothrix coeruleofusca TaxID=33919 RepID=A0A918AHG3_9PSEU|nr:DUF983 domain-containing protein [Saccharothrix coeruleofusca]MBP2340040.1 uncharacterized protein (DUF983 family) [Saccharothrix coeruleofusca]GGP37775.1 hypothetical protein GCM10010185_06430 [Saccharothrix coeruleofusca]